MSKFSNKKNKRTKNNNKKNQQQRYTGTEGKWRIAGKRHICLKGNSLFCFSPILSHAKYGEWRSLSVCQSSSWIHCERPKLGWNKRQRSGQEWQMSQLLTPCHSLCFLLLLTLPPWSSCTFLSILLCGCVLSLRPDLSVRRCYAKPLLSKLDCHSANQKENRYSEKCPFLIQCATLF